MKNLILCLTVSIILFSCSDSKVSKYETRYSSTGDSTVYVNYVDNRGISHSFFMEYALFSMLYRNGGYYNCYNYYNMHPSYFHTPYYEKYNTYTRRPKYYDYDRPNRISSPSSPSRSYNRNSFSSPSRITTINRSYSSPSRSYSNPTRSSYSSPTRTYSSSRSYSSPSRSYSSPSRSRSH